MMLSGAKSPLAQFICGWIVGFVLLFLTPVFQNGKLNPPLVLSDQRV